MARRKLQWILGTQLKVLGAVLIFFGIACLFFIAVGGRLLDKIALLSSLNEDLLLIACIIGLAFIPLGALYYREGKRSTVISAEDLMSRDKRPPVLYLRPFEFDDFFAKPTGGASEMKQVFSQHPLYRWSPLRILETLKLHTSEEILSKTLKKVGPCITVGKPGLERPIVGFARFQLSHDRWQAEVKELMEQSGLVVLCAGNTTGLLWELEQVAQSVNRDRFVLLIAPDTHDVWWEKADTVFGQRLTRFGSQLDGSFSGIIYFDEQGNSHPKMFLPVEGNTTRNLLEEAFSAVFERLQVPPRPKLIRWVTTPRNIFRMFMLTPVVIIFLGFVIVILMIVIGYINAH